MSTKTCSVCKKEFPLERFAKRSDGSRFAHCKSCRDVAACARRRAQRKSVRDALADAVLEALRDGPMTAHALADRIGHTTTAAVATAIKTVSDSVEKRIDTHGSSIYSLNGTTIPARVHRSHTPALHDPWSGIDDEHREWMRRYRAQHAERQARIAQKEQERAK